MSFNSSEYPDGDLAPFYQENSPRVTCQPDLIVLFQHNHASEYAFDEPQIS